jgi:hypothetical protein
VYIARLLFEYRYNIMEISRQIQMCPENRRDLPQCSPQHLFPFVIGVESWTSDSEWTVSYEAIISSTQGSLPHSLNTASGVE